LTVSKPEWHTKTLLGFCKAVCYRDHQLAAANSSLLGARIQLSSETIQAFATAHEQLAHRVLDLWNSFRGRLLICWKRENWSSASSWQVAEQGFQARGR
jgi:hypothetical protein